MIEGPSESDTIRASVLYSNRIRGEALSTIRQLYHRREPFHDTAREVWLAAEQSAQCGTADRVTSGESKTLISKLH